MIVSMLLSTMKSSTRILIALKHAWTHKYADAGIVSTRPLNSWLKRRPLNKGRSFFAFSLSIRNTGMAPPRPKRPNDRSISTRSSRIPHCSVHLVESVASEPGFSGHHRSTISSYSSSINHHVCLYERFPTC